MVLFQEPGVFDTSVSIQGVTGRPRRIFAPDRLKANLLIIESSIGTTVYSRENALMLQARIETAFYGRQAWSWRTSFGTVSREVLDRRLRGR